MDGRGNSRRDNQCSACRLFQKAMILTVQYKIVKMFGLHLSFSLHVSSAIDMKYKHATKFEIVTTDLKRQISVTWRNF